MDTFAKVKPGQPLRVPAELHNRMIDLVRDAQNESEQTSGPLTPIDRRTDVVLVRNDSGADVGRWAILGLSSPIVTPTANETEFQRRIAFSGVEPAAGTHEGFFVVMQEPLASGKIGRGVIAGATVVNVTGAAESFADIMDADTTQLTMSATGSAQVLWADSGSGTRLAIVRVGPARSAATPGDTGLATTCDIWNPWSAGAADFTNVACELFDDLAAGYNSRPSGVSTMSRWTHYIEVDVSVDIRDAMSRTAGTDGNSYADGDKVVIPTSTGSTYVCVWVEQISSTKKRAYLLRDTAVWPGP